MLRKKRSLKINVHHFRIFRIFRIIEEDDFPQDAQDMIVKHIRVLKSLFRKYFSVSDKDKNWIVDTLLLIQVSLKLY